MTTMMPFKFIFLFFSSGQKYGNKISIKFSDTFLNFAEIDQHVFQIKI